MTHVPRASFPSVPSLHFIPTLYLLRIWMIACICLVAPRPATAQGKAPPQGGAPPPTAVDTATPPLSEHPPPEQTKEQPQVEEQAHPEQTPTSQRTRPTPHPRLTCSVGGPGAARTPGPHVGLAGDAAGHVTVLTILDPNCPHCATVHGVLSRVREMHPRDVRFEYLPLPLWRRSLPKVEALYAAAAQGGFEPMLAALFERQHDTLDVDGLVEVADRAGLDPERMRADLKAGTYREEALSARATARQSGVRSVPHVYVGGRHVDEGNRSAACLSVLIKAELLRSGKRPNR